MKLFTLVLILTAFTLSSCNQEKNRKEESAWTKLDGDCAQEGTGVSSTGGCLFRINTSLGDAEEINYTLKLAFTSNLNSTVEIYSANNAELTKGIVLRMERDANAIRFYVRDHKSGNHQIIGTDVVVESGMTYKLKHVRKIGVSNLSLFDDAGFKVFDTTNDLTVVQFNTLETGGNSVGFRIKNAVIKSASF